MSNAPITNQNQQQFVQKVPDIILPFKYNGDMVNSSPKSSNTFNSGIPKTFDSRFDESVYREMAPAMKNDDTLTKLLQTQEQLSQEKRARGWIESELQAGKMHMAALSAKVDSLTATVESDTSIIRDLSRRLNEADKQAKESDQALLLKSDKQILKLHQMFSELLAKQRQSETTSQDTEDKQRMILEEMNHMRYKLEAYSLKTNEFGHEVNARSRDLEHELQRGSDTFRKLAEHQHMFENLQGNVNSSIEQLQKKLEQASSEIRHKLEGDARNRIQFENNMRELHQDIRKTIQCQEKDNNDRIESLKANIFHQADRDRADKERISLNLNEQLRVIEKVVKENQVQFLEKSVQQYINLEANIEDEKISRKKFETEIRSEYDEGFKMIRQAVIKKSEENQQHIVDSKIQMSNAIKALQESLILAERGLEKKLLNAEEVLRAEIKARMDLEQRHIIFSNEASAKIDVIEEKILSRIEEAIQDLNSEIDKVRREIQDVAESLSASKSRNLDDLDSRISQLSNRSKQTEIDLQAKIQLALSSIESIKAEQADTIEASEAKLSKAISLLQNGDEDTLKKVLGVELLCSNIKNEIDDKLNLKSTQLDQTMEAFKSELSARVTVVEAKETQADLERLLVNSQKRLEEMSSQVNDAIQGVKDRVSRNELDEVEIRLKSLVSSVQARLLLLDGTVISNSSQLSERSLKSELHETEKKLKEMIQDLKIQNSEFNNNMVAFKNEMSDRITKSNLLEAEDRIKNQIHLIDDRFTDIYSNIVSVKESISVKANNEDMESLSKALTKDIDHNEQRIIQALDSIAENRESIISINTQKIQDLTKTVTLSLSEVKERQNNLNASVDELKSSISDTENKMTQKMEDIIISQKKSYESQSAVFERLKELETENYSEMTKRIDEIPEKISDLRNQQHELRQWMIETTQIEGETVARALVDIKRVVDTKLSENIFNQTVGDLESSVKKLNTQFELETIEINQLRLTADEHEHNFKDRLREVQINMDRTQKEIYQSMKQQRDATIKTLDDLKERQSQIPKLIDRANIQIKNLRSDIEDRVHNEIQKVEKEIVNIKGALQSRVTERELDDAIGDIIRPIEGRIDRLTIDFDDFRLNAENDKRTELSRMTPDPTTNHGNFYKPPHRSFTSPAIEEEPLNAKGHESIQKQPPEVDPRLERIADSTSEY